MKTQRPEKRIADLVSALRNLVTDATRVSNKYGHLEDGTPSDWNEWIDLRRRLTEAEHALARERR